MSFLFSRLSALSQSFDGLTAHLARRQRSHPRHRNKGTLATLSQSVTSIRETFASLPTFGLPAWRITFSVLAFLCMYASASGLITISFTEDESHHRRPHVSCKPIEIFDALTFFGASFFAHAATVKTLPGEDEIRISWPVLLILIFPFAGINRGVEAIMRRACLPHWDRQSLYDLVFRWKWPHIDDLTKAARAGALCTFVRSKGWEPSDGMSVYDMELQDNSKRSDEGNGDHGFKLAAGGPVVHNHFNYVDDPRIVRGSKWSAEDLEWSGYRIAVLPSNVLLEPNSLKTNPESWEQHWDSATDRLDSPEKMNTAGLFTNPFDPAGTKLDAPKYDGDVEPFSFGTDIFNTTRNSSRAHETMSLLRSATDTFATGASTSRNGLVPPPSRNQKRSSTASRASRRSIAAVTRTQEPDANCVDNNIHIPSSRNLAQVTIAAIQLLYASITLYRTRVSTFSQTGSAAFALVLIPFLIMTCVNLVGNLLTPSYPAMYLVSSRELSEARTYASWIEEYGFSPDGEIAAIVQDGPGCSETSMTGTFESLDPFRGEWTLADTSASPPQALREAAEAPPRRESIVALRYIMQAKPAFSRYVAKQGAAAAGTRTLRVPQCSPFRRSAASERWHPRTLPFQLLLSILCLSMGPFIFMHVYTPHMARGFRIYWTSIGVLGGGIMPLWPMMHRKLPRSKLRLWTLVLIVALVLGLACAIGGGLLVGKWAGEQGACRILEGGRLADAVGT